MPDLYPYDDVPVLKNKLDIKDDKTLDLVEAEQSRLNMMLLYERGFDDFSPDGLREIHRVLFGDIYDWAGEYRLINIEKRESLLGGRSVWYSNDDTIADDLASVFQEISSKDWRQMPREEFVHELTILFPRIWRVHPFREGNTRTVVMMLTFFVDSIYVWTKTDDGYTVTATQICNENADKTITETVTAVYAVTTEPGCETAGAGTYTATFTNDAFASQVKVIDIAATGHELVKTEAADAACEEAGSIEYWTCSTCGKLFSDEAATKEIGKADTVIAALGHDWDDGQITAIATVKTEGRIQYTCKRCGQTRTEDFSIEYTAPEVNNGVAGGVAVEEALAGPILANQGYSKSDIAYYEITMTVSLDNGKSFVPVTPETMPEEGLVVTIPYPTGTNAADHDFIVTHRLADGTVETLTPTESADGLKVTVHSLSPFAVGYKDAPKEADNSGSKPANTNGSAKPGNDAGKAAKTGDESELGLWITVLLLCGLGTTAVVMRKKRQNNTAHPHR